jgi:hypothetical protein
LTLKQILAYSIEIPELQARQQRLTTEEYMAMRINKHMDKEELEE